MMKDSKQSSPGTLSPLSPQSPQSKRTMSRLRRLLHAMEQNEAPSNVSWRSISSRAQMAQDLWRQVQMETEEETDYHWLQDQVDEACQRAHQFARQRFEQEAATPDLIQTVFFAPTIEEPRSRAESRDTVEEMDPELGFADEPTESSAFLAPPLMPSLKSTTEELQKAQRAQIEEAIAQMASQMKEETRRIHAKLQGQTQELNTMEDLATQNVQKVGQVADDVKTHVKTSWRRTFATWTLLLTIFATFIVCIMTMQIVPKRRNACLWFGCERPLLAKFASNTYSLVKTAATKSTTVLEQAIHHQSPMSQAKDATESHHQEKDAHPLGSSRNTCEMNVNGDCVSVFHKTADHVDENDNAKNEESEGDCTHQHILQSAQEGQLGELQRCLSLHPEWINQADNNQWSAIHEASHAGWLEVVEYLVHAGASLDSVTNSGLTPLELAMTEHGQDHEITKFLQHHVAESQPSSETEDHPGFDNEDHTHQSDDVNHENEAHENYSDVHREDFAVEDAEHSAARQVHDSEESARIAEEDAANPDESALTDNCSVKEFQWLATSGNIDELQRCLSLHPDWLNNSYEHGWTALHEAARGGHADVLEHLLKSGANAEARTDHDHTPLDLAREHLGDQHDVTQILLRHTAQQQSEPSAVGENETQHYEAHVQIETIAHHTPDGSPHHNPDGSPAAPVNVERSAPPADNCSPDQIQWMAHSGNLEELERCLPLHPNYLNRADGQGWTPLHEASRSGHTQVVEFLLRSGANADARTDAGKSSLDLAHQYLERDHAVTQTLRRHTPQQAVDHSSPPTDNCPPDQIQWMAHFGNLKELERCLPLHPGYLNRADGQGWTPLHEASRAGHTQIVEYLLHSGANVDVRTDAGKSPLDLAHQHLEKDHAVIQILLRHTPQQHNEAAHAAETNNVPNPQEATSPEHGECQLHDYLWFASVGQLDDMKRCLSQHSAWLNQADENGWTATHEASRGGHVQTLEYLLQAGAVVNVLTNLGRSPLDLARQFQGDDHVVTRMLQSALSQSHP